MDEGELGREQARLVRRAMTSGGLRLERVWWHYFSLGGAAGELEVQAFLHHALVLPRLERDMLAHAVNELLELNPRLHAPYTDDLLQDASPADEEGGDEGRS